MNVGESLLLHLSQSVVSSRDVCCGTTNDQSGVGLGGTYGVITEQMINVCLTKIAFATLVSCDSDSQVR